MFRKKTIYLLKFSICTTTVPKYNTVFLRHLNAAPLIETNSTKKRDGLEEKCLIRIQNDPDIFGPSYVNDKVHQQDLDEGQYLTELHLHGERLSTKKYADIIKDLIRQRKIKEAIDIVEVRMLKEDKVKPENYIYNLLLGACGRVGYTKKAFSLYNEMKRRALDITPGTYTALFNACANSPWPEDGLSRAKHLHEIMIENQYDPNNSNYNSMIKAYGRCGDLKASFALVDEMISKNRILKSDTLNFLLQACITDKEAGFRHSLLVWRKFIDENIIPSIFSYNLMLRSIRDCGLGNIAVTEDVISRILPQHDNFFKLYTSHKGTGVQLPMCMSDSLTNKMNDGKKKEEFLSKSVVDAISSNDLIENRPNLMARVPHMGDIICLSEVVSCQDRLLLVGGISAFLSNMAQTGSTPDIKTFTLLLDVIPGTLNSEKELLAAMKKSNVKPDIDFYNCLIKKRSIRMEYEAAKEVLRSLKEANYKPNLITYGVLALGCKNKEEASELLEEIKRGNYRLNIEILGAMLQQASFHYKFGYVFKIMDVCLKEKVLPNKVFIQHLENLKQKCKDISNDPVQFLCMKTLLLIKMPLLSIKISGLKDCPLPFFSLKLLSYKNLPTIVNKILSNLKTKRDGQLQFALLSSGCPSI